MVQHREEMTRQHVLSFKCTQLSGYFESVVPAVRGLSACLLEGEESLSRLRPEGLCSSLAGCFTL